MSGEVPVAAQLMPFAAAFWERGIGPLSSGDVASVKDVRKRAAKQLGAERTATLWEQGAKLSLEQAVRLALGGSR